MDDKMMAQLLASYKAPMTIQNANAARAFFASNPDVAEHRAMGMRGSAVDDNSDLLDAQLDKHIADTAIPEGRVEVGQPVKADVPAPSIRGATTQQPMAKPTAAPVRLGKQDTQYGEGTGEQLGPQNQPDTGGFGKWLLALLGTSAAGALASARGGNPQEMLQIEGANPGQLRLPAPQPKLTSNVGPNQESVGQELETINQRKAAGTTQMKAQVADENADIERQLMADMERQAAQRRAQSTVNAAKRAVGRK